MGYETVPDCKREKYLGIDCDSEEGMNALKRLYDVHAVTELSEDCKSKINAALGRTPSQASQSLSSRAP